MERPYSSQTDHPEIGHSGPILVSRLQGYGPGNYLLTIGLFFTLFYEIYASSTVKCHMHSCSKR